MGHQIRRLDSRIPSIVKMTYACEHLSSLWILFLKIEIKLCMLHSVLIFVANKSDGAIFGQCRDVFPALEYQRLEGCLERSLPKVKANFFGISSPYPLVVRHHDGKCNRRERRTLR